MRPIRTQNRTLLQSGSTVPPLCGAAGEENGVSSLWHSVCLLYCEVTALLLCGRQQIFWFFGGHIVCPKGGTYDVHAM